MNMEMNVVVDRGKLGAESLVETMRQLPPMERFGIRRKSRAERVREAISEVPVGRVALAAAAISVLAGLAYIARRRLFAAAAVVAEGIEEAADAVEDATEDVAEAAGKRSGVAES
jgi:hypothetical protein